MLRMFRIRNSLRRPVSSRWAATVIAEHFSWRGGLSNLPTVTRALVGRVLPGNPAAARADRRPTVRDQLRKGLGPRRRGGPGTVRLFSRPGRKGAATGV